MHWIELSCRVDNEAIESVSEAFAEVSSGGIAVEPEITSGADDGFEPGPAAVVRGYLPADELSAFKTARLETVLGHLHAIWPIGALNVLEIDEDDWATAWKSHYNTFHIGKHIVIRPSWQEYQASAADVVIALDPGAAFGTGLHPTTRRCIELLDELVLPGDRVLDVGTGSGILGLASLGLGATSVTAIDVDPLAVKVARDNARVNGHSDQMTLAVGTLESLAPEPVFDLVVANIIARVIIDIAPRLASHLAPHGTLVVSGVISDRADEVAIALAVAGLVAQRHVDGDWVSFSARHRTGP